MRESGDHKKKGNRASIGPPVLGEPSNGKTGTRVPEVRYDRSAATLPPEIADDGTVLSGPSYFPATAQSHT